MTKVATNTGVHVMDLCFIRTFINLCVACITVKLANKHLVKDVPVSLRGILFFRSVIGIISFTFLVYGLQVLPIFITSIILNTMPFWVSLLSYLFIGEIISRIDLLCMIGCFIGVLNLSFAKHNSH